MHTRVYKNKPEEIYPKETAISKDNAQEPDHSLTFSPEAPISKASNYNNIQNDKGKNPAYSHKDKDTNTLWNEWEQCLAKGTRSFAKGLLIILRKEMIVIDIDDEEYAECIEEKFPQLSQTATQKTSKGKHYFFKRSSKCDEVKLFDSTRRLKDDSRNTLPIDIKTVCSTGTGGVISIFPSKNKIWMNNLYSTDVSYLPDDILDFILKHHEAYNSVSLVSRNRKCNQKSFSTNTAEVQALVDLLSPDRAENYDSWIKVGWCLHNIGQNLIDLWIEFSKRCPHKFKAGECEHIWSIYMRDDRLNIGSLHLWARQDSPYEYKHMFNLQLNHQLYFDIKYCRVSHNSIANIAYKILKNKYVCATSNGKLWYYFNDTLWEEDPDAMYVRKELSNSVKEQFHITISQVFSEQSVDDMQSNASNAKESKEIKDRLFTITMKLEDGTWKDRIVREMREFLFDKDFINNLDNNINLIAFNNGVWDLQRKLFRPSKPEDFVSISVGYDYIHQPNPEKQDLIKKYWELMHPVKDQRDYCIKTFARQLYGDSGNEHFHIHAGHQGTASNGKTKFFEILEAAMGDYVKVFPVEFLTAQKRPDPGRPMPEFANWKGRRILYCTEPNYTDVLNSGIMKAFTGAEKITYRFLFSNQIHSFRPQFKMHIMTNDAPKCDGSDEGIKRRIRKIDYMARFVEPKDAQEDKFMFAKDEGIIYSLIHDHGLKMEFLRLLLESYDPNYRFDPPEIVKVNSSVYLDENNSVAKFVHEFLEHGEQTDFVTLKEVRETYRKTDYCDPSRLNSLKKELEKQLKQPCFEQKKIKGKNITNVFIGIKIKQFDENEEDNNEVTQRQTSSLSEQKFYQELKSHVDCDILTNKRPLWLKNTHTGFPLELDLWIPSKDIAIEYDGPHHCEYPNWYHKNKEEFKSQLQRDQLKNELCEKNKVKLIRVQCIGDVEKEVKQALSFISSTSF
ncbi:hypothetical protein DUNSADRAFT_4490 [Dunaliella salina]|uniref:SF3 helicase domain-containing protein n=1 Tax=Dunaliella salina TaxID=3046 RepID=A0ABQ7FUT0_DUNSA|nr:hypothetical protein DUNSADRAFT_4490 [Dunaliella salina]|eukprot:KAF5826160.1 hypothetical protein DUNSADRAFT_4490 [Dunaliella salina]